MNGVGAIWLGDVLAKRTGGGRIGGAADERKISYKGGKKTSLDGGGADTQMADCEGSQTSGQPIRVRRLESGPDRVFGLSSFRYFRNGIIGRWRLVVD